MGLVCIRNGCLLIVACALIQKTPSASGLMYLHRECALGVGMRKLLVKIAAPQRPQATQQLPSGRNYSLPSTSGRSHSLPSSGRRLSATQRLQASSGRRLPASASSQRPQDPSDPRFPAATSSHNSGCMLQAAAPNPCHPAAATPCYPAAASSQPPSSRRLLVAADSQRPQSPSDCRLPATEDTQRLQARVVACACSRRPQPLRATQRPQPCSSSCPSRRNSVGTR